MERALLEFAQWLESRSWSGDLHSSFYMYNWIESTHVVTLVVSLGLLAVIDLRMLGLCLTEVPASKLADRLAKPMAIGFLVMFATGILLFSAIPVRTTQSIWFRIKMVLLIVAAVNAILFHRQLRQSTGTWESSGIAPRRLRVAAGLSLALWIGVVTTGRFIAYDWFDCGQKTNNDFVNWAAGCVIG